MIMVKKIREQKNLTQHELAKRSGVKQSAISMIESGERKNPGILTLEAIAFGLGCTLNDIYKPDTPAA